MKLLTWNVQWCRGVDGRVDPQRIVYAARDIADFDVLCLQEIAANFADPSLAGSRGEDQFDEIAGLLPGYTPIKGVAVDILAPDRPGRRRFGNLILSRHPVQQAFRHLLPMPLDPGVNGMRRMAIEAHITAPGGAIRVVTTHLEYYGVKRRAAQVEALRAIYAEGCAYAGVPPVPGRDGGPYESAPVPAPALICGDFNLTPSDPLHERLLSPFDDGTPPLIDTWAATHPGHPRTPTFRIYEKEYEQQEPYACDYIFASADLAPRIRRVDVDTQTQASDHQPVLIELG
jgi:endonuclease/exonuclease/phosphatase family metal-dependent hydrolase